MNEIRNKAIEYGKHFVSVIPVSKDKKPLVKWQEFQKRRAGETEITKWWEQYPEANVGIITGEISGITVIDVEEGGDISKFPETTTIRTGGGGWHLYYQYEPEVNNKSRILPFTDIRGDGGYVVAPPSIHESGRKYEALNKRKLAVFPRELFGLSLKKKSQEWQEIISGVSEGSRNETGTQIVGKLIRAFPKEQWETTAWVLFQKWNEANQPPLSHYELRNIFNSIANKELFKLKPREAEEAENKVNFYTFTEVLEKSYNELINTKPSDIISFGYDWLDNKLTGIFKADLIVIGGETSTGKTTFATNIIYKASKQHKCCIFALEDRLVNYGIKALWFEIGRLRKLENKYNYPWNDYRSNKVKDELFRVYLGQAKRNLENSNIYFSEVQELMSIEVLERLITQKRDEGFELFLIDHLHYFDLLRGKSSKSDYIEATVVRIKTLQKRTDARIILVVHYRKLEGKKPTLDSFKDSIAIVQNADYVLNLWRDRTLEAKEPYKTLVMCPKSRNPNGEFTIEAKFNPLINDYEQENTYFGTGEKEEEEIKVDKLGL